MKLQEPKSYVVGRNTFYIRPFPAFMSSRIAAKLSTMIGPILSGAIPLVTAVMEQSEVKDEVTINFKKLMDADLQAVIPSLSAALSSLSDVEFEGLMRTLLVDGKNIAVAVEGNTTAEPLTEDLCNELFCCEIEDMILLAVRVCQLNFGGFFKKYGIRFGDAVRPIGSAQSTKSTENLT